jgi:hypothetical protein
MVGPSRSLCGISVSEIEAYANLLEFNTIQDRLDLLTYVKFCDAVWLEEMEKRRPKKRDNARKHPPRRR